MNSVPKSLCDCSWKCRKWADD